MALRDDFEFNEEPIYLMDGNAFIFRAFYANSRMARSDSFPTGAIYSVGRLLLKILREEKPKYFCFILDGQGKNFRHDIYPEYKAQRPESPDDLKMQFDPIKNMVQRLGIKLEISENCEADDCIASLAKKFSASRPVVIVGVDKDLRQCLNENVIMWDPASKSEKIITEEIFTEETGLSPAQWADVQALIGDSSDNIPGVKGIGEKTAIKIFQEYTSLEDLKDNYENLALPIKKKMEGNLDVMFMYRELTKLNTEQCTELDLQSLELQKVHKQNAEAFFSIYELNSLHKDFNSLVSKKIIEIEEDSSAQGLLLANQENSQKVDEKKQEPKNVIVTKPDELPEFKNKVVALIPSNFRDFSAGFYLSFAPLPKNLDFLSNPKNKLEIIDEQKNPPKNSKAKRAKKEQMQQQSLFAMESLPKTNIIQETKNNAVNSTGLVNELLNNFSINDNKPDFHYVGDFNELIPYLQKAAQIVVCDLKNLMHNFPTIAGNFDNYQQFFDLSLASWLLWPDDKDYAWASISVKHIYEHKLSPKYPAKVAQSLYHSILNNLQNQNLLELMYNLEMPLVPVLYEMEQAGIAINLEELQAFLEEVQNNIEQITKKIYFFAGENFNIRSAQQLGDILFKKLKLPTTKSTKGGQASTSYEVLEKLLGTHPIIDALQEYRKFEKMRSTYLEPLQRLSDDDGRIRTTLNQWGTATGRLSSSNPNLQNIPIRGALGLRMRSCFTAKPKHLLVSADYSQVELRVLAHFSKDKNLCQAFLNKEDIHTRTASLLYDVDLKEVNSDMRRHAKTINFGLLYGMGVRKLAEDLHISQQEAKKFMEKYFARFEQIKKFYEEVENFARENAYVITLAGRQRPLQNILSKDQREKALAERQAVNTLIQGSAADIIKLAMLAVDKDQELKDYQANLLLQIHDELVLEVPEEYAEKAGKRVAELMENIAPSGKKLIIPLEVDFGFGQNWGIAH